MDARTDSVGAFLNANTAALDHIFSDHWEDFRDTNVASQAVQAKLLMRHKVAQLLLEAGEQAPPVNLLRLARFRGIRRIVRTDISVDGRIVRRPEGYEIELPSRATHRRRRFSLAHELAHTFFLEHVPVLTRERSSTDGSQMDWRREEALCDFGAAEMLMPAGLFLADARAIGPSMEALKWLARRWDVSLEACAVRLTELKAWPVAFLWFYEEGGCVKLRRTSGVGGSNSHVSSVFRPGSPMVRALNSGKPWAGRLTIRLGGPAENYFCDVLGGHSGGGTVLVIRDEQAPQLCSRSRLQVWSRNASRR